MKVLLDFVYFTYSPETMKKGDRIIAIKIEYKWSSWYVLWTNDKYL